MRRLALAWLCCLPLNAAAWQGGFDASVAAPGQGPFELRPAPGFGAALHHGFRPGWSAGLHYSQHSFFGPDYYVSARSLDLRLRRQWSLGAWAEAGLGVNPMAWHYSNWPGWTRVAAEAGWQWPQSPSLAWEAGLGLAAFGPPGSPLLHGLLRFGPRWAL